METEGTKVRVSIFGQTYTIKGETPPSYIQGLADYLNEKMIDVSSNIPKGTALQIAILAALNITDEYFQMKKLKSENVSTVEEKASRLISMLDEGLVGEVLPWVDPEQ